MTRTSQPVAVRRETRKVHPAWWVATTTGLVILVTGWSTGMPGVLTNPLLEEFGWSRGVIDFAFAVNIVLYGLTAPFAAALMDRFGIRAVVGTALIVMAAGAGLTAVLTSSWQLVAGWGLLVGLSTGSTALTFAATVANRWFVSRRGLVSGVLTSASMFGGMVLMPLLARIVEQYHWRAGVAVVGLAALALLPMVLALLRDHPADLGLKAHGALEYAPKPAPATGVTRRALVLLARAARTAPFWLLAATFALCGGSTNGIMMTHFVPAASERGMPAMIATSLLLVVGVFNTVGAAGSGWLTDRLSEPWLLVAYYALRAVSLLSLPLFLSSTVEIPMVVFVVGYGLLDLATVPPTIGLCRKYFGEDNGAVIFGWVSAAHAVGAGAAAFFGGVTRELLGSYTTVWIGAGVLCAVAATMSLGFRKSWRGSALAS